jgi:hypothetical protein
MSSTFKPQRDGTMALTRTPLERIDPLAALIPPPRRHRHRYPGVPAPNAPLRAAVSAFGREVADATGSPSAVRSPPRAPASNARSLARDCMGHAAGPADRVLPRVCPNGGADMRLIAFITEAAPVEPIRLAVGEPSHPPLISSARGPPV